MKLKTAWNKLPAAKRMHHLTVPIVGLTGGIATGKSTVAKLLIDHGLPVINADLLVKSIYAHAETKEWIRLNYPDSMKGNEIDFKSLRENFFTAPAVKDEIEAYIYARMPDAFNLSYKNLGRPSFVIYDVPLLFE
ncbi:MAG: dephospho-CoA kinase, partial [Bacteriovoracaceae bacterium]